MMRNRQSSRRNALTSSLRPAGEEVPRRARHQRGSTDAPSDAISRQTSTTPLHAAEKLYLQEVREGLCMSPTISAVGVHFEPWTTVVTREGHHAPPQKSLCYGRADYDHMRHVSPSWLLTRSRICSCA